MIQQLLADFLRRRGWVVFYLDKEQRNCNTVCWLKLYEMEENKEEIVIPLERD